MFSIRESVNLALENDWEIFPLYGLDSNWVCTCGNSHEFDSSAGKHPMTTNGMKAGTNSREKVEVWLGLTSNFGVVCRESGLCILDVDPRSGGFESLERLRKNFPGIDWDTITARTGMQQWPNNDEEATGDHSARGTHFYFAADKGMSFKANLGPEYPGIDIKHNGYVVLPGSKHPSRSFYEWGKSPEESRLKPFPAQLHAIALRTPTSDQDRSPVMSPPPSPATSHRSSSYGLKALETECSNLMRVSEGKRNAELYTSGLRMGSLVAGGHLTWDEAYSQLTRAGLSIGLSANETAVTLSRISGTGSLQRGMESPRGPISDPTQAIPVTPDQLGARPSGLSLNLVDWEEAFTQSQDVDWLVPGIIASGRGHAIYSAPGLGKSLLTLEIAACLAKGCQVLGHQSQDPLKVLYLDQENNIASDVVPRLKAMGFSPEVLKNLAYVSFPEFGSLDGPKGLQIMESILDEVKPKLVIFDTLARFVEGEENSNNTWNNFYINVGVPMKRRGIAYLRLDHSGKNEDQGMRGGSAKVGDLDLVWRMGKGSELDSFYLTNEKSRLPLESKKLKLTRTLEPALSHSISIETDGVGFAKLVLLNQRFLDAQDLIRGADADLGFLLGQKKMWSHLREKAQAKGIRQNLFNEAHKAVRQDAEGAWASD